KITERTENLVSDHGCVFLLYRKERFEIVRDNSPIDSRRQPLECFQQKPRYFKSLCIIGSLFQRMQNRLRFLTTATTSRQFIEPVHRRGKAIFMIHQRVE